MIHAISIGFNSLIPWQNQILSMEQYWQCLAIIACSIAMTFKELMLSHGLPEISEDGNQVEIWFEVISNLKNMEPVMVHWWFIFDDSIISIWCSIFPWWFMEPMMIPNIFLHPSNDSWRIVQEKLRVWRLHSPNCLRSSCLFNAFEKIQFSHVCDWGCMYKYIDNDNVKPSISYDNNVYISVYYIKNCKDCIETSQIWFDLDFLTKKTLPAECIRNEVCMDFPCCNCHQSYKSVAVSCAAASSKAPSLAVYHESISL